MKLTTLLCLLLMVLSGGGCHVISKASRQNVDTSVSLSEVRAEPDLYQGKTLLLGGVITGLELLPSGSTLEVLPWRLDRWGEPVDIDMQGVRFLVSVDRMLDPVIYPPGRLITLTGTVSGVATRDLGTVEYRYPVLQLKEIYPWETPYRYGLVPNPTLNYPPRFDETGSRPRTNPYDPSYYVYPYSQYDFRPGVN